jgi:cytochrome c oxidase subunit 2
MIGEVTAMTAKDYENWLAGSTSGSSLAQNGERIFASLGCNACHSGIASARGPNLAEAYGSKIQLANGSYTVVDDAFLRDSILNPSSHETAGYAPIMPTYQGQVSEEGLIDLVEYIKALHSNDRVQQTLNTSLVQSESPAPGQGNNPEPNTVQNHSNAQHSKQVQRSVQVQRPTKMENQ